MSIENPTLVHFRHFSSLYTNEYRVSRYESFMQNKPNLLDAQMNVTSVKTMNYEQITMNYANKNKANTKPIKANLLNTQMNVSSVLTKDYENVPLRRRRENKPKTNPIKPNQTQTKLSSPFVHKQDDSFVFFRRESFF